MCCTVLMIVLCLHPAVCVCVCAWTQLDRQRVEGMEVFSTVLWHMKRDSDLSYLAQDMLALDRLAPQVGGGCSASLPLTPALSLSLSHSLLLLLRLLAYVHLCVVYVPFAALSHLVLLLSGPDPPLVRPGTIWYDVCLFVCRARVCIRSRGACWATSSACRRTTRPPCASLSAHCSWSPASRG